MPIHRTNIYVLPYQVIVQIENDLVALFNDATKGDMPLLLTGSYQLLMKCDLQLLEAAVPDLTRYLISVTLCVVSKSKHSYLYVQKSLDKYDLTDYAKY